MSMNTDRNALVAITMLLVGLLCGLGLGRASERARWEKELIRRGVAEYSRTTGKWVWCQLDAESPASKGGGE